MNNSERVVKHLEFIQGVVNRLGANAFLLKGWSMTVLVAGAVLMVRLGTDQPLLALTLIVPVIGFWILDGYFLWQERLFRAEYDRVRQQDETDFSMNPGQHKHKPRHSWMATIFSVTLVVFYAFEVSFVVILACSVGIPGNPVAGCSAV